MSKRPGKKQLVYLFMVSLVIVLIGGGAALLEQWQQGPMPGHASSSDTVVGPPSLPASYVDKIFRSLGSPMVGTGQVVEQASRAQNIDDAFALAVWWTETNDGAAGVGLHDRNPGSVRGSVGYPSAYDGYTIYPSYSAAVTYWFSMMKRVYINRGLTTVYAISHPYVGTSTSNLWAGKVVALMQKYHAEAPKIPVTPTATAKATVTPVATPAPQQLVAQRQAPAQKQQAQADSGMSETSKTLILFFSLLLALGLGLWARNMLKRYTSSAQLSGLLKTEPPQTAGLFKTFTGGLQAAEGSPWTTPTTEGLTWSSAPSAEALATTNAALPIYSSDGLLAMGAFMASQAQGRPEVPVTPQPAPTFGGQPWGTPQPGYPQATRPLGAGLPSRLASNSLHRTRLMPSQGNTGQYASPFAPGSLPTEQQPQPVLTGRSNGLLSRYREVQEQGERQG